MQLTFQKSFLLRKSVYKDHKGLKNHFVSLALLLPYLLHIVFLLKAINLCGYLCQVGMLYERTVRKHNQDLQFHSYANFNFRCDFCFRAFTQAETDVREGKNLKRSFHILHPKGKSCMFKMELECKFGYKRWILNSCDFFLLVFKVPGTSVENVYFNTLFSTTRCSSKILYQNILFCFKLHLNL